MKKKIAHNPYLPGKTYVPDGEPRIFRDRLYLYGSHDEFGETRYCTGSYQGWSAPLNDLGDWRYEGEILKKGLDPLDPRGNKDYYAPDVVQGVDDRYYLYYSIEGSNVISVAVCDEPAGSYQFLAHVHDQNGRVLGSEAGDYFQFDPAVLVDNGRVYLYVGQGLPIEELNERKIGGALVCELASDMVTAISEQRVLSSHKENIFTENPFFEASSIRKFNDTYYFIYSALPNTHLLCYATSKFPDRDFVYQGVLVSNADIFLEKNPEQIPFNYWGNNHGSLIKIFDEYYVFYHRSTNKSPNTRQGMAERIQRDSQGRFLQAEMTSNGLHQEPFTGQGTFFAYTAWALQKKDMKPFVPFAFLTYDEMDPYITQEETTDIPFIANLTKGATCGFRYFQFTGGEREIKVITRGQGVGNLQVYSETNKVAELTVGGNRQWQETTSEFKVTPRDQTLTFQFSCTGGIDFLVFEIR